MEHFKILFVCLGNICRSPAAEGIMLYKVKDAGFDKFITIDSAGTAGYHVGELPDHRMRKHALQRGYQLESHARPVQYADFDNFDLLVAMDDNNYHDLKRMARSIEQEQKVVRMTDFAQTMSYTHVPDPYYEGHEGFELVLDILEDACSGLLKNIQERLNK